MTSSISCWLVLLLVTVNAFAYEEDRPRIYCGRFLARAQAVFCEHMGEYPKKHEKRDVAGSVGESQKWPGSSSGIRVKRVPGLVDECCRQPCTMDQILNYC